MDFKSDFAVRRYVEMEVEEFNFFDTVWQFNVLVPFYFLALCHEAYRNRVPQFCCDSTCFHNVVRLSHFDIFLYWLLAL
ncbi:hypothetical protein D7Y41_14580 [Anaerotruncus sp. 1XD22-93]|jgi:hypothetical protein|nr:hypothetical protein D7Y41_14580 [Anaerotruncus sp. 1XD22-93]